MAERFARLEGAEIFAAGKWNGLEFSEEDLDKIVQSFEFFDLGGRVPLKLGHNDEQPLTDGQPALGWVEKIWREGGKLKANFSDVPRAIYDLIKNGLYKFVSVELLRDVIAGTRTVPLVLDAVALLGADLPAVGTLKDLQALTMARRLEGRERLSFTQAFNSGDVNHMADEDKVTAEQLEQMRRELAAAKVAAAQNEEKFTKLEAETRQAKVNSHRKAILEMFEDAVRSKKILPAVRERFLRRFKIETDDTGVMMIPLGDVEGYIRENPNPFLKASTAITASGDPDEIPSGGLPDRELMARARRLCRDRGKNPENWEDLKAAGIAIMRADPQLAERYRALPDDHADGKYSA